MPAAVRFGVVVAVLTLVLAAGCATQRVEYALPSPDRPVELPGDFASHPEFQTEWWYFTGHLFTEDGRRFGFELVFFRRRTEEDKIFGYPIGRFANPLYMSHFAITDLERDEFIYDLRMGREDDFTGIASTDFMFVKVDDWRVEAAWPDIHIYAYTKKGGGYTLDLVLTPQKPAVIHGKGGISRKDKEGQASYYISFTRLKAAGVLTRGGESMPVSGVAWHDHEIMSAKLGDTLSGWKWFAIILDNDTEIMMFQVRRVDGSIDPYSSATVVFPDGKYECFYIDEFEVEDTDFWYSKKTEANYPVAWRIRIPKYDADLVVRAVKKEQELRFGFGVGLTYWEGACDVSGTFGGKDVSGCAYVEMTGYGEGEVRM